MVDADPDAPLPWLVTGFVAGPSLAQAVADFGPLPVASVLALAAGLAEGLGAVHAAGVVHRDLKPSNVLLAEDGPQVIDFDISQAADLTLMTGTGAVVGSPGFMSPEQAKGSAVGLASDIFSLGAVLVFAATGEGPFGSGDVTALLYRVVHNSARLKQFPSELRPLIEPCLAKDPAERPTAAQFLANLAAAHPAAANLTDWLPEPIAQTFARRPAVLTDAPRPAEALPEPDVTVMPRAGPLAPAADQAAGSGAPATGAEEPSTVTAASYRNREAASPVTPPATRVVSPDPGGQAPEAPDMTVVPVGVMGPAPARPASLTVGPASPTAVPAAAAAPRRRRRRWVTAAMAVVTVFGVAAGLLIWAPWKRPPVLRPAGLIAGTSTTSSTAFRWSSPATGPVPDRYVILQDGTAIGSVPGTVTFYQARGLAPDTAYHFQVMAVRGSQHSAKSSVLTEDTLIPPISAALLEGQWTAHQRVVIANPSDWLFTTVGKEWADTWNFTPDCVVGPCGATLSGAIKGYPFTVALAHAAGQYVGTTRIVLAECGSTRYPIHDRLRFRITVSGAGGNVPGPLDAPPSPLPLGARSAGHSVGLNRCTAQLTARCFLSLVYAAGQNVSTRDLVPLARQLSGPRRLSVNRPTWPEPGTPGPDAQVSAPTIGACDR